VKTTRHLYLKSAMIALLSALLMIDTQAAGEVPEPSPIKVKVVLVTMFEIGEDTGDQAAEFQLWYERRDLNTVYDFGGHHKLHYNPDSGLLAIVTGIGTARAAASIAMLGMDPRFDLTQAYWLVAGIAGFDPQDASLGSAAWAEYLVDGDLSHEIDAREIPDDWPYGYFARYTHRPFDSNKPEPTGEMFQLNPSLTEWAFQLTRDMELPDSKALAELRAKYTEHPNARKPPFVLKGDHLAALTFWHGNILNNWANDWVDYWTEGKGEFVSSAMEDTGTMQAMTFLDNAGRADRDRVMVLRTASNYTMPPPGVTAAQNLLSENEGYTGLDAALESAYRVGSRVIDEILANWDQYQHRTPVPVTTSK
jgi:purine nucleoside permease